jgi:hypothetical protein
MTDPNDAALAALGSAQEHAYQTRLAVEQLAELFRRVDTPARLNTVVLTQTEPIKRDETATSSLSIGVYNPSPVKVFWGIAGGKASQDARAPSQPPSSLLVLPVAVEDLELGANAADLAAGDAVLYVLRFDTVQPAFLGVL